MSSIHIDVRSGMIFYKYELVARLSPGAPPPLLGEFLEKITQTSEEIEEQVNHNLGFEERLRKSNPSGLYTMEEVQRAMGPPVKHEGD